MKNDIPSDKSTHHDGDTPFNTAVGNLNKAVLQVADAIATIPGAAAIEVASTLHGPAMLRKRGLDQINQHPVSRILDTAKTACVDKGPIR